MSNWRYTELFMCSHHEETWLFVSPKTENLWTSELKSCAAIPLLRFMRVATVTKCGWQCVPGVLDISIDTYGVQILQGDVTSVVFLKEVDCSFVWLQTMPSRYGIIAYENAYFDD